MTTISTPDASTATMPQRMLDAAICAYAVDQDTPFKPDEKYLTPIEFDGEPTTFLSGFEDDDAGLAGVTKDGWAVLSLRGTLSTYHNWEEFLAFIADWLQDDETRMVPFEFKGQYLGNVEQGFCTAISRLWPQITAALDDVDWTSVKGIQITGHSKGAAMTFLAAAMVRLQYPAAKQIAVHAFAAAQAGGPDFADWYRSNRLDVTTTRYQRHFDIVPFVPPTAAWDIFEHLTWHSAEGLVLYSAIEALGLTVYGGYEDVGAMVYLPGMNPVGAKPVTGSRAITAAQQAIVYAVAYGHGEDIASAHSAKCSYWPAMYQTANTDSACS